MILTGSLGRTLELHPASFVKASSIKALYEFTKFKAAYHIAGFEKIALHGTGSLSSFCFELSLDSGMSLCNA